MMIMFFFITRLKLSIKTIITVYIFIWTKKFIIWYSILSSISCLNIMNSSYTPCLSIMNLPSISYLNIIKFKTINDAYI